VSHWRRQGNADIVAKGGHPKIADDFLRYGIK
jgi:hypothetical protein